MIPLSGIGLAFKIAPWAIMAGIGVFAYIQMQQADIAELERDNAVANEKIALGAVAKSEQVNRDLRHSNQIAEMAIAWRDEKFLLIADQNRELLGVLDDHAEAAARPADPIYRAYYDQLRRQIEDDRGGGRPREIPPSNFPSGLPRSTPPSSGATD